jgi:hypothetical protein
MLSMLSKISVAYEPEKYTYPLEDEGMHRRNECSELEGL